MCCTVQKPLQSRNRHTAAVLLYAAQMRKLKTIHEKFLECSHTYMEGDCTHATTELAKRNVAVYSPHQASHLFLNSFNNLAVLKSSYQFLSSNSLKTIYFDGIQVQKIYDQQCDHHNGTIFTASCSSFNKPVYRKTSTKHWVPNKCWVSIKRRGFKARVRYLPLLLVHSNRPFPEKVYTCSNDFTWCSLMCIALVDWQNKIQTETWSVTGVRKLLMIRFRPDV